MVWVAWDWLVWLVWHGGAVLGATVRLAGLALWVRRAAGKPDPK